MSRKLTFEDWVGEILKMRKEVRKLQRVPPIPEIKGTEESSGYQHYKRRFTMEDVRRAQQAILCNQRDACQDEDYAIKFLSQKGTANDVLNSEALRNVEGEPDYSKPKPNSEGKDWEIMSVQFKDGRIADALKISNTDKYNKTRFEFWKKEGTTIHSVKRLSDGEVFSVGDDTTWGVIHSFAFENDKLVAECGDKWSNGKRIRRYISHIQKPQHQQESKRIEVTVTNEFKSLLHHHNLYANIPIPDERYGAIKSAIEKILNNE